MIRDVSAEISDTDFLCHGQKIPGIFPINSLSDSSHTQVPIASIPSISTDDAGVCDL